MKLQRTCSKVNNVIINSPMFRDSRMRTQDVGEGKMSTKNTLLLHTKLFRALRNGSENTMNTRKWISFASSRSSRTFFVPQTRSKGATAQCVANQQETSTDGQGPRGSGNRKMVGTHTGNTRGKPRIQDLLGSLVSHARLSARASQSTNSLTLERPPL